MRIRKCTEQDVPDAGAFYDQVVMRLDHHVNYPKWLHGVYPSEESVRNLAFAYGLPIMLLVQLIVFCMASLYPVK